jgi:hypothetical protein
MFQPSVADRWPTNPKSSPASRQRGPRACSAVRNFWRSIRGTLAASFSDPAHSCSAIDRIDRYQAKREQSHAQCPPPKRRKRRVVYRRPNQFFGLSIDPMALVLTEKAYLAWVEGHHPHELKVSEIQAAPRTMTPEEQNAALSRARTLGEYGKAVEKAIAHRIFFEIELFQPNAHPPDLISMRFPGGAPRCFLGKSLRLCVTDRQQ